MNFLPKVFLTLITLTCCEPSLQAFTFPQLLNIFRKTIPMQPARIGVVKLLENIDIQSAENFIKKVSFFAQQPHIDCVLLVINSGGGICGLSELMFREVKALAARKPVVVLVASTCGSGAYETAVGAPWIVAPASAHVGHIGAVLEIEKHTNQQVHTDTYTADVTYEVLHAGKYKVIGFTNTKPLTDEDRALLQQELDALYKIFCTIVAQQRNLSLDELTTWADGQNFTGEQALALGLIDQIGGYSDAVAALVGILETRDNKKYAYPVFYE